MGQTISNITRLTIEMKEVIYMSKRISSIQGLFGETLHYNEDGDYLGYSVEGLLGETLHYNASGEQTGFSCEGAIADAVHYDADNNEVGYDVEGMLGVHHYSCDDGYAGYSVEDEFGMGVDAYLGDNVDTFFDSMDTFDDF